MVKKIQNIVHNESLDSVETVQIMLTGALDKNWLKIPALKAKLPYVLCLSWIHQTFNKIKGHCSGCGHTSPTHLLFKLSVCKEQPMGRKVSGVKEERV